MPIHYSPMLCFLTHVPPWTYRYTDSLKMMTMLFSIIQCYSVVDYPRKNPSLIKEARATLMEKCEKLNDAILESLKGKSEEDFYRLMEGYTIDRIQLHEACIWKMFGFAFPVELVLTPNLAPEIGVLEEPRKFFAALEHYFQTKDMLINVRSEKASPEGEYVQKRFFTNHSSLGDNPYKGYFNRALAREYFLAMTE